MIGNIYCIVALWSLSIYVLYFNFQSWFSWINIFILHFIKCLVETKNLMYKDINKVLFKLETVRIFPSNFNTYYILYFWKKETNRFATKWAWSIWWNTPGISGLLMECPWIRDGVLRRFTVYSTWRNRFFVVLCLFYWPLVLYGPPVWLFLI